MKKKVVIILLGFLFIINLVFIGYSQQGEAADTNPTVNWVLQHTETSNTSPLCVMLQTMANAVSKRTDGKFKIRLATVGELGIQPEETPSAVADGTIEMTNMLTSVVSGFLPQIAIYDLPYLTVTLEDVVMLESAIHKSTITAFRDFGYEPVSDKAYYIMMPQDIISSSPIDNWEDLGGLKIRVWRTLDGKLINAMGGESIYMSGGEVYIALQRGVIDAVVGSCEGHYTRKLYENAKYFYSVSLPRGIAYIVANSHKLAGLPENYRNILKEEMDKGMQQYKVDYEASIIRYRNLLGDKGVELLDMSDKGVEAWRKGAAPIWKAWAKEDPRNKEMLDFAKSVLKLE